MKFCGKYCGKYNKTVVNGSGVTSSKGKAVVTISEVGKGAYLINTVKDGNSSNAINELAYLEDHVLRSEGSAGNGITSTYFDHGKLVQQSSTKSNNPDVWTVVNYCLKKK
jgi:thiamine kinase-like enzyme